MPSAANTPDQAGWATMTCWIGSLNAVSPARTRLAAGPTNFSHPMVGAPPTRSRARGSGGAAPLRDTFPRERRLDIADARQNVGHAHALVGGDRHVERERGEGIPQGAQGEADDGGGVGGVAVLHLVHEVTVRGVEREHDHDAVDPGVGERARGGEDRVDGGSEKVPPAVVAGLARLGDQAEDARDAVGDIRRGARGRGDPHAGRGLTGKAGTSPTDSCTRMSWLPTEATAKRSASGSSPSALTSVTDALGTSTNPSVVRFVGSWEKKMLAVPL